MKKLISVLLVMIMLFTVMSPAVFAADALVKDMTPIVYIRGNGEAIYDENGDEIPVEFADLFDKNIVPEEEGITKEKLVESCANILLPFLAEGLLMDKWDNYGKAIYDEFSPLFEKAAIDGDGNPKYNTGVSPEVLAKSEYNAANIDFKKPGYAGYYRVGQYDFCYDWRLSPYDHVERLHKYILTVMETTGSDGICIAARCLGGSLLHAYLDVYGHLGHVKRVFYGEVLANGSAYVSQCFSGKFDFDAKHLQTYLKFAEINNMISLTDFASEIVTTTMDLFVQTNVLGTVLGDLDELYGKLYQALIPALLLSTGMATMPNYWASVYEEDMDDALDLIFGKEGTERRKEYSGLIEKIQRYRKSSTADLTGFYDRISKDYGIEVGVFAKYGYLSMPVIEDYDELSDSLIGLKDASFGATCSTVKTTLSDKYIAGRIAQDPKNAKYISVDKMVDVSTAYFPETTWIVKNCVHSVAGIFDEISTHFLTYKNLTVDNNTRMAQFSMYEGGGKASECYVTPMTEENCASFEWLGIAEEKPTLQTKLMSLFKWLTTMLKLLTKLLNGEIVLGSAK